MSQQTHHPRIAFVDIDGTLFDGFVTPRYIMFLAEKGLVSADRRRHLEVLMSDTDSRNRSYRDWASAVTISLNDSFHGLQVHQLEALTNEFAEELTDGLYSFTGELFAWFQRRRIEPRLVTGAHSHAAFAIAHLLSVPKSNLIACELHEMQGRLINRFVEHREGGSADKARYVEQCGISRRERMAFGDSESDLSMLEAVSYPVLVRHDATATALLKAATAMGALIVDANAEPAAVIDLLDDYVPSESSGGKFVYDSSCV